MESPSASLFEGASGGRLHCDPNSDKCKFLPLGGWKNLLTQDTVPLPFMRLSDHLDMLGVKLCTNYSDTKRINGEILVKQVKKKTELWKTGRFMPLVSRTWSVNSLVFSKLWYKTASIDLRVGDISKMTSEVKSWIYQLHLTKPQESLLYRDIKEGGLGLFNIAARAKANILVSFC